jgi:hypothetical protein
MTKRYGRKPMAASLPANREGGFFSVWAPLLLAAFHLKANAGKYSQAFAERIRHFVSLFLREREFKRELRRPLREGPENATWNGPDLRESSCPCGDFEVSDDLPVGGTERVYKQVSNAERRDLRISG